MYRGNRFTHAAWNEVHVVDETVTSEEALWFLALTEQDRKFTSDDVLDFHEDFALAFLKEYTGDFEFLVDIKIRAELGHDLSVGAVCGVLNCMRAENKRQSRKAEQQTTPLPDVKAGRYCLLNPDTGLRRFYQVDKPSQGRWEGFTFLKELHIGGSDNGASNVRDHAEKLKTLEAIHADPDALARYGRETGVCGACGKTLTDPESVKRGIGPVCWGRGF